MKKIDEAGLRNFGEHGLVTAAVATATPEGDGYTVAVTVEGREVAFTLYGTRRHPRKWKSLDRCVRFLTKTAPSIEVVTLYLKATEANPNPPSISHEQIDE